MIYSPKYRHMQQQGKHVRGIKDFRYHTMFVIMYQFKSGSTCLKGPNEMRSLF